MEKISENELWSSIEKYAWLNWVQMKEVLERRSFPIATKGYGIYVEDIHGKKYIDGLAGAFCVNIGYGNAKVIKAIKEQAEMLQYNIMAEATINIPSIRLMEKIGQLAPGDLNKVFLTSSGSEASEVAIKIARQYFLNKGKRNFVIVAPWMTYHGSTLGAMSVSGRPQRRTMHMQSVGHGFHHIFPPYCYRCFYGHEYPDCDIECAKALEETIKFFHPPNVAAFMSEPIFGSSGIIVPPDKYWPMVRKICNNYGVLLIIDEVATGWGRTGKLFAQEHWGIVADIMTSSKGISSQYQPLSATVTRDHVYNAFLGKAEDLCHFFHGHTAAGHPIACAATLANIEVILEEKLSERAAKVGEYALKRLKELCEESRIVGDVRGKGLFIGVEIVSDKKMKKCFSYDRSVGKKIAQKCAEKSLIIGAYYTYSDTLLLTPPLIITKEQMDDVVNIMAESIKEVEKELL